MRVSLEESHLLSEIELVKARIWQDAKIFNTMVQQLAAFHPHGWKGIDLFAPYLKALSNVPKKSNHLADRSFFEKLPIKFINEYHSNLDKHLIDNWRSDDLVPYILGGQPVLAREFARMIIHYDSESGATEDENNEFQGYCFPNAEIVMDVFHNTRMETEDHVSISVSKCMTFLTSKSDLMVQSIVH